MACEVVGINLVSRCAACSAENEEGGDGGELDNASEDVWETRQVECGDGHGCCLIKGGDGRWGWGLGLHREEVVGGIRHNGELVIETGLWSCSICGLQSVDLARDDT